MIYSSKKILFFILLINFTFNFPTLSYSRQFLERDYIIIDLKSGVEWLRCSTGQTWNGKECEGQIVRLNFKEIQDHQVVIEAIFEDFGLKKNYTTLHSEI